MDGIFGFTGIVLFIIGLIMLIVRFIKKTNKKTPMILLIIGIIFTTVGFSLSHQTRQMTITNRKAHHLILKLLHLTAAIKA